jgi:hypothetical protein
MEMAPKSNLIGAPPVMQFDFHQCSRLTLGGMEA